MRVLYVHHRPEAGGAPTSLALLIEAVGNRVEALVVCPDGPAAEQFRAAGARVRVIPIAAYTLSWRTNYRGARRALLGPELLRLLPHLRALRRAIREFDPDVVHLNEVALLPAAWLARRMGRPVVWHARVSLPAGDAASTRLLQRWIARLATVAVAINEDVAASLGTGANVRVVNNPVRIPAEIPVDGEPEAKRALGLDPGRPAVGMVSNLYASKGWRDAVKATASLVRDGRAVQLALVGRAVRPREWFASRRGRLLAAVGGLENTEIELERSLVDLGASGDVTVVPFQSDVAAVYRALDLVVFPSRGPEVGRPVLEGQAFGRAVVTTGSAGGAGCIRDGVTGVLATPGDPESLAAAIGELLADPERRREIGSAARRHAEQTYALPVIADRMLEIYRHAVHEHDR